MLKKLQRQLVAALSGSVICALAFLFCYHLVVGRDLLRAAEVPNVPVEWLALSAVVGAIGGALLGSVTFGHDLGRPARLLSIATALITGLVVFGVSILGLVMTKKGFALAQERYFLVLVAAWFAALLLTVIWLQLRRSPGPKDTPGRRE